MPSKWRWTNISDERERKRVEASRAFGLELLVQIDKNSFNARTKKDADKDTEEAGFWFDLAEWCVATRGYGNLMIARRCADIGNLPLGRLATVESVRNEILVALEQRAKTSWDSPEDRRRILNDEAQAEVFPVAKDQEPSLRKFFGGGVVMRQEQRDPSVRQEIRTLFGSEPPPKLTVLPLQGLLFFKDEESRPNSTTITGWWPAPGF